MTVSSQSFNSWLRRQSQRNDSIGDIARDIVQDRCWPRHSRTRERYRHHLLYHQAIPQAVAAFERAYNEWESYYQQQQQPEAGEGLVNDPSPGFQA